MFVLSVCLCALLVRVWLLRSGPDIDSDAYGHMDIGQKLVNDPLDTGVHWVWLPLWHYVCAAVLAVGGTHDTLRGFNALLSSALPGLLAALLLQARRPPVVAALAALFAVSGPFILDHGQSGEPEPLFCALLLCGALCWPRAQPWATGLLFALACLLRYEAWVLLPAVFLLSLREPRPWGWLRWALPTFAVFVWCWVRARGDDGEWFAFIRSNRAFVKDAQAHGVGVTEPFLRAIQLYSTRIPFLEWGPLFAAAPLGLLAFHKHAPRIMVWVSATLMAFVTYGWVRGHHLGLPRHMFALVPAYAWMMAEGAASILRRRVGVAVVLPAMLYWYAVHLPHALDIDRQYHVKYTR